MRYLSTAAVAACMCLHLSGVAAAEGDDTVLLQQRELRAVSGLDTLSAREVDELLAGETVVQSGAAPGGDEEISVLAVHGWRIVEAPRLLVWLTLLGTAGGEPDSVTQAMLEQREDGSYVKYQHLDLPWPVANRHWVILVDKDVSLADASDGKVWRHEWSLIGDGPQRIRDAIDQGSITSLEKSDLQQTVYLPANRGAWTLVELSPYKTLVAAYYDFDMGGFFPGPLVRAFISRRLRSGLGSIDELVDTVDRAYTGARVIDDGFGSPVDPQDVRQVAAEWRNERQSATAGVPATK